MAAGHGGTHQPDSDADVAILLRGDHQRFLTTKLAMADTAFDVLLATGINISPLPIWLDEWEHPRISPIPSCFEISLKKAFVGEPCANTRKLDDQSEPGLCFGPPAMGSRRRSTMLSWKNPAKPSTNKTSR